MIGTKRPDRPGAIIPLERPGCWRRWRKRDGSPSLQVKRGPIRSLTLFSGSKIPDRVAVGTPSVRSSPLAILLLILVHSGPVSMKEACNERPNQCRACGE